jgi:glycosyltransferase involved in cell wall biosynthesis
MKIFFNRVPRLEPYGGGNQFLQRMTKLLGDSGHEVVYHLNPGIDVIFMMDPRPGDIGYSLEHITAYKNQFPDTKILHRVNECDARKGTKDVDPLLLKAMFLSDKVVFISGWLKKYFEGLGYSGYSEVIYNGCDLSHFFPENREPNKKLKLVTHHWSDNWMKGFDLYTKIDQYIHDHPDCDLEFTYVGRYCKEYKPTSTNIVAPLRGKELGNELRKHDIYVTASRFEPCGMHHIEGAASGLPVIFHKDTGGIRELCLKHGEEYSTFREFLECLYGVSTQLVEYQDKIDYNSLDINLCVSKYYDALISMK